MTPNDGGKDSTTSDSKLYHGLALTLILFLLVTQPVENRSIKWKWKKKLEWGFPLVRCAHSRISPFKLLSFSLYGPVLNQSRTIKRINTPDLDQISYLMSYYPNTNLFHRFFLKILYYQKLCWPEALFLSCLKWPLIVSYGLQYRRTASGLTEYFQQKNDKKTQNK